MLQKIQGLTNKPYGHMELPQVARYASSQRVITSLFELSFDGDIDRFKQKALRIIREIYESKVTFEHMLKRKTGMTVSDLKGGSPTNGRPA